MDQIDENPKKSDQTIIKQKLLALRVVTGSMWAGMFIFLGMTVFLQPTAAVQAGLDSDDIAILQLIGKSLTALAVAAAIVLRMSMTRLIGRAQTLVLAMQRYFVVTLMVFALCEGVAFFCLGVVWAGASPTLMYWLFSLVFVGQLIHYPTYGTLLNAHGRAGPEYPTS